MWGDKSKLDAKFHNNIFFATGQVRFRTVYTSGYAWERKFDDTVKLPKEPGTLFHHNCYFGPWMNGLPDDDEKLVADPMFFAPGTGGEGFSTLGGYKLKLDSPYINTGMLIEGNTDRDFYGNPINGGSTDFGVYEQIGSGAFASPQIN